MGRAIVKPGQTLADISVQHCGGLTAWAELATMNGLSMTASLSPGQSLALPGPVDKRTVALFKSSGLAPAAGTVLPYGDGIGFWVIENDFIVQ